MVVYNQNIHYIYIYIYIYIHQNCLGGLMQL